MLHLFDRNKNKISGLTKYKDYCIESDLKTGDKTLSFLYPKNENEQFEYEGYLTNSTDEFVIKSIPDAGDYKQIVAVLNREELEGKEWEFFESVEQSITDCLALALAGTGWTAEVHGVSKLRTIRVSNKSTIDILTQARRTYGCEIKYDTLNKKVIVCERLGSYKGVYFMEDLNLKDLSIQGNSYEFYTRLVAIGKTTIDEQGVETPLKVTVTNNSYSSKVKTIIWKDERYTNVTSLAEDATAKLAELAKPYISYGADVIDLAKLSNGEYDILSYELGDDIDLISKSDNLNTRQRIIVTTEFPDEPHRNSCQIANSSLTFEDIQQENFETTAIVQNITADDGTVSERALQKAWVSLNGVNVQRFNAVEGRVGTLEVNKLDADTANIKFAEIDTALIDVAHIDDLTAANITFEVAEGNTMALQTLLSNFISGNQGQFLNLTTQNTTIANAVIKNAMIDTISASKINSGAINTNLVDISGTDGKLLIRDNTIQISDATRVRVQIGKDASNDYSMYVWDDSGNLMFDATGLKAEGIKSGIIRNDMVASNANISGSKLDISSVITAINGNTATIKSSKIEFDDVNQTLDVVFNSLSDTVDSNTEDIETNSTSINVINGQIQTLITNTTITEGENEVTLKDKYIALDATVTGLSTTVGSHSTSISSMTQTISSHTASLELLSDGLSLKLSASDVKMGIKNLLKDSRNITNNSDYLIKKLYLAERPTVGGQYTISLKGTLGTGKTAFGIYNSGGWVNLCMLTSDDRGTDGVFRKTFIWKNTDGSHTGNATYINVYVMNESVTGVNSIFEWATLTAGTIAPQDWGPSIDEMNTRVGDLELDITADAINTKISGSLDSTGEITTTNFTMDKNGFTVKNGAITIKNKAGVDVIRGDSNGDLMIRGNIYADPDNPILHLFSNCSIDATANNERGVGSAVRFKWDLYNYLLIDANGSTFYQNNGNFYFTVGSDKHPKMGSSESRVKYLNGSVPQIQARNGSDTGYISMCASSFVENSSEAAKTNIEDISAETCINIVKNNDVMQYNLKDDITRRIEYMELSEDISLEDIEYSGADPQTDKHIGLILERLTTDAYNYLHINGSEGLDLYTMVSILWKVTQSQQIKIEELESDMNGTE